MDRLTVLRATPSPGLSRLVRCYWIMRMRAGPPGGVPMMAMSRLRLAIDMTSPLILDYDQARHVIDTPTVGGLASRPYSVHLTGAPMEVFFVEFTESGFFALFGDVGGEITDGAADLWDLLPGSRRCALVDELREAPNDAARRRAVERLLIELWPAERTLDRADRLAEPLAALHGSPRLPTVRELAADVGVSQTYLRRRFQALVGASPRAYLARERARRAFQVIRTDPDATGAEVAQRTGFFDQAHLIRELRRHTGYTPSELRAPIFASAEAATW